MFKLSIKHIAYIFFCVPAFFLFSSLFITTGVQAAGSDAHPGSNAKVLLTQPNEANPVGHPGTIVNITLQGFTPNSNVNLYTVVDSAQCMANGTGLQPFTGYETVTIKADGTFAAQGAQWPQNANTATTPYFVCAVSSSVSGEQAVSQNSFTVAQNVTTAPSATSVTAGETVVITGDNWLPPQQIRVEISPDATPSQGVVGGTVTPNQTGHFSIKLTLPANTAAGSYTIYAYATNEQTMNYQQAGAITVTSTTAPTPTPAPSPSPVVTPTAAPSPSPVATTTPNPPSNNGGSGGGSTITVVIYTLGALGAVLIVIGLILFLVSTPSRAH